MNKNYQEMDQSEAIQRLLSIEELVDNELKSGNPMLTASWDLLNKILNIATGCDNRPIETISRSMKKPLNHVIISCDASITENPGGEVAVGVVIEYKNNEPLHFSRRIRKSKTNNEGEYDAIYFGLTQFAALHNNPGCEIEVRSDSKLVVDQINGTINCNKPELLKKRDNIRELIETLPVPVSFQWRPRNSTPALEQANYLAQDMLGIKRH